MVQEMSENLLRNIGKSEDERHKEKTRRREDGTMKERRRKVER
jgi:hypothetical protein